MKPIARLLKETFGSTDLAPPPAALPARRRRKLWQLSPRWHSALIGACLPIADLRRLAKRTGLDEADLTDYEIQALVGNQCTSATEIAGLIQHYLDEHYALALRQFAKARGAKAVRELWRKAVAARSIGDALWAASTHADLGDDDGNSMSDELAMLAYQLAAHATTGQKRLSELELENVRLRDDATTLRHDLAEARRERERCAAMLAERIAAAAGLAAQRQQDEITVTAAQQTATLNAALTQRLAALEEQNRSHKKRIAELEAEPTRDSAASHAGMNADRSAVREQPAGACLSGRRVLCIGGRTALIDHYRRLVEASGGRFFHHDGGREESIHRIDAIVAGADAVVCQAAYVSHAAYWLLKDACKQRGLPCVFLKSGGVTSFARSLDMLASEGIGSRLAN